MLEGIPSPHTGLFFSRFWLYMKILCVLFRLNLPASPFSDSELAQTCSSRNPDSDLNRNYGRVNVSEVIVQMIKAPWPLFLTYDLFEKQRSKPFGNPEHHQNVIFSFKNIPKICS